MGFFQFGVDWRNKGYICWDARVGDELNRLQEYLTAYDYSQYGTDSLDTGYTITIEDVNLTDFAYTEKTYPAFRAENTSGVAVDNGMVIFQNGSTYTLENPTDDYILQAWVWGEDLDNNGSAGFTYTVDALSQDGTVLLDSAVFTWDVGAANDWGKWQQISFDLSGASGNIILRIYDNQNGRMLFYVTQIMLVPNSLIMPSGFNTGVEADLYDYIDNALDASWSVGTDVDSKTAPENLINITVNNTTRVYSDENTTSPLYGYLLSGREIKVFHSDDDPPVPHYTGEFWSTTPTPFAFAEQIATLQGRTIKTRLDTPQAIVRYFEDSTADVIIQQILTDFDASIPSLTGDTGETTFAHFGDNINTNPLQPETIYAAIAHAVEAERGLFYFDRQGNPRFRSRNWMNETTLSATFNNDATAMEYIPTGERVINSVSVTCYPRAIGSNNTDILWENDGEIRIPAGRLRRFRVPYRDNTTKQYLGATDVQAPSGGDFVSTGGSPSISISARGQHALIIVDNTAGASTCVITTLKLRGRQVLTFNPALVSVTDDDLIASYGERVFSLDLKGIDNTEDAESIAQYELIDQSQQIGDLRSITLQYGNYDITDLVEIESRVRVIDTQLAHDREYYILGYNMSINATTQILELTYFLKRAPQYSFWVLGTSELGIDTVAGY